MVEDKRGPKVGRIQKLDKRKKSRKIKATIGILSILVLVTLIIISIKYDIHSLIVEEDNGEISEKEIETTEVIEQELNNEDIEIELINGSDKASIKESFLKLLSDLDFKEIKTEDVIMPVDVKTGLFYVLNKKLDEYELLNIAHSIKNKTNLPSPRRLDLRITIGQDIPELHKEALTKEIQLERELNIEVLNGSGIEGAAGRISKLLESKHFNVVSIRNADNFNHKKTSIHTGEGMKEISKTIAEIFGIDGNYIKDDLKDIIIIAGENYN
jgi:hypothetical protein